MDRAAADALNHSVTHSPHHCASHGGAGCARPGDRLRGWNMDASMPTPRVSGINLTADMAEGYGYVAV
jgi:hypothetical protein